MGSVHGDTIQISTITITPNPVFDNHNNSIFQGRNVSFGILLYKESLIVAMLF